MAENEDEEITVTTSSQFLCLGDSVILTCSAQGSARWRSDAILGPGKNIYFVSADEINTLRILGNGTAVLLQTSPRVVTYLSFNLTVYSVKTLCTDSQLRNATTISSVQPRPTRFFAGRGNIVIPSSEFSCLEVLVQLNCIANGSARWQSDILGPGQSIDFVNELINTSKTVGNGTAVLIEKDPHNTVLSFNLTTDRVETHCTDSQTRTTTTVSYVQPRPNGDHPVNISGGSITWGPPTNINKFSLQNYQLTIECNGTVVDGVNTNETTYSYDEGKLIPGLCNVTVRVINSCGDTASNSIIFPVISVEVIMVVNGGDSNTGLSIGLGVGLGIAGLVIVIVVLVVLLYKNKKKKNEETGGLA